MNQGESLPAREAADSSPTGSAADQTLPDASLPSLESIVKTLPEETRKALEEELRGRFVRVQRIDPSALRDK